MNLPGPLLLQAGGGLPGDLSFRDRKSTSSGDFTALFSDVRDLQQLSQIKLPGSQLSNAQLSADPGAGLEASDAETNAGFDAFTHTGSSLPQHGQHPPHSAQLLPQQIGLTSGVAVSSLEELGRAIDQHLSMTQQGRVDRLVSDSRVTPATLASDAAVGAPVNPAVMPPLMSFDQNDSAELQNLLAQIAATMQQSGRTPVVTKAWDANSVGMSPRAVPTLQISQQAASSPDLTFGSASMADLLQAIEQREVSATAVAPQRVVAQQAATRATGGTGLEIQATLAEKVSAALSGNSVTISATELNQLKELAAQMILPRPNLPAGSPVTMPAVVLNSADSLKPENLFIDSGRGGAVVANGRVDEQEQMYTPRATAKVAIALPPSSDPRSSHHSLGYQASQGAVAGLVMSQSGINNRPERLTTPANTSVNAYKVTPGGDLAATGLNASTLNASTSSMPEAVETSAARLSASSQQGGTTPAFVQYHSGPEAGSSSIGAGLTASVDGGTSQPATAAASSDLLTRGVDAANLHAQVMRVIADRRVGQNSMTVQLSPASLGSLEINFSKNPDGEVNITVITREAGTREFIEQFLPRVRLLLTDAGVSLGSFDVHEQRDHRQPGQQGTDSANTDVQVDTGAEAEGVEASDSKRERGFHVAV